MRIAKSRAIEMQLLLTFDQKSIIIITDPLRMSFHTILTEALPELKCSILQLHILHPLP